MNAKKMQPVASIFGTTQARESEKKRRELESFGRDAREEDKG